MSEELKQCPFCGSEAKFGKTAEGGEFIACTNSACGASTSLRFSLMDAARPLLVEQWNRRTDPLAASHQRLKEALRDIEQMINEHNADLISDGTFTTWVKLAFTSGKAREALRSAP